MNEIQIVCQKIYFLINSHFPSLQLIDYEKINFCLFNVLFCSDYFII